MEWPPLWCITILFGSMIASNGPGVNLRVEGQGNLSHHHRRIRRHVADDAPQALPHVGVPDVRRLLL